MITIHSHPLALSRSLVGAVGVGGQGLAVGEGGDDFADRAEMDGIDGNGK